MNKKIGIIYSMLLLVLCSCHNELASLSDRNIRKGVPVQFTVECPQYDMQTTRSITDKREFKTGDVIHVSAVFKLDKEGESEKQYATLTLTEEGWVNETDFPMNWPWNAVNATFTAYYLEKWNGPITDSTPLKPVVLDRFVYQTTEENNPDPLKAEVADVKNGHAVHLKFRHLCTRLTIEDIGDEEEYWLKYKTFLGEENSQVLLNACQLTLQDNTLKFEFVHEESDKVSAQVFTNEENGKRTATFHLAPDNYSTFMLRRRNDYPYITISQVDKLNKLEANKEYVISLENLTGNIHPDDSDDEWWNDRDPEIPDYKDFKIQDFLNALQQCEQDYICNTKKGDPITVLKKDEYRKEMHLMTDVDFEYGTFQSVELPNTVTFDGGGKSILGVAHPLFSTLYGTVKELDIENAKIDSKDSGIKTEWGILARECDGGIISNVNLINSELKVTIPHTTNDPAYNIGALIGWVKSGNISNIQLVDNISVTVDSQDENSYYILSVGGVIGQFNGTLMKMSNLTGGSVIHVTNSSQGHSTRYTGGVIGHLNGIIQDCEVNVMVDASKSIGTWNYVGGIAGVARTTLSEKNTTIDNTPSIMNISVVGSVIGGRIPQYERNEEGKTITSHSSTGGIVGHVQAASVTGGVTFSKVSIATNYNVSDYTYYTIGGVIGSMKNALHISNNEGWDKFNADFYKAYHYHAGTFCGGGGTTTDLKKENTAEGTGAFVGTENKN